MSNLIPPLVSSSPPPIITDEPDDLKDDEFGDFTAAADLSFEGYSLPTSPQHSSYSNYTSSSFQTPSNLIISPKIKDRLDTNKVSENIFCDIKDVNTIFVNNCKSDEINDSNFGVVNNQNVQSNTDTEVFVPRINETHDTSKTIETHDQEAHDTSKTIGTDHQETHDTDFGDFNCFPTDGKPENRNEIEDNSPSINLLELINDESIIKSKENIVPNYETVIKDELKQENTDVSKNKSIIEPLIIETISSEKSEKNCSVLEGETSQLEENISEFLVTDEKQIDDENFCEIESTIDTLKLDEDNNLEYTLPSVQFSETTLNDNLTRASLQIVKEYPAKVEEIDTEEKQIHEISKTIEESLQITEDISDIEEYHSEISFQKSGDNLNKNETIIEEHFGEFTANEASDEIFEQTENLSDEFGDFSTAVLNRRSEQINYQDNYTISHEIILKETKITNSETLLEEEEQLEDNFVGVTPKTEEIEGNEPHMEESFGDFTSVQQIEITDNTETKSCHEDNDFDEFGDFSDYTQKESIEFPTNFDVPSTETVENAEKIINDLFSDQESELREIEIINFVENAIFKQLNDIENTCALSYQWAVSKSQRMLLTALNIDSRNILFGPRWNASMPRFAANLGFAPLEPLKSEIPALGAPGPISGSSLTPVETINCDIPAAKFDWTSSGLVNPLDLQATDVSKQEPVEDKSNLNQSEIRRYPENIGPVPIDLSILNNFGSDNESVNSLKFIETPADIDNEIKLSEADKNVDDFTSFQSSKPEKEKIWTPSTIPQKLPIRESHISNYEPTETKNQVLNIQQFELESTIVTPELSRKNLNIPEDDDEFSDFQMSLPQESKLKSESEAFQTSDFNAQQETIQKSVFIPQETNQKADFVGTVPLEPLKPIVLEPSVINNIPAQINWPEPGVLNENISEIEFSYISTKNKVKEVEKPVEIRKEKAETAEEDDWSDFVCAQRPDSNKTPNLFNMSNNKSSHLELSIPNLQNNHLTNKNSFMPNSSPTKGSPQHQIGFNQHPPYQISLQAINTPFGGLPQTSLSTYNNFTIGPTELSQNIQSKTSSSNFSIFDGPFNPEIKPFQSCNTQNSVNNQVQPEFQNFYQVQSVESTFLKMQQPPKELNSKEDDDDWSDFVSSQPVSQPNLNGFGQKQNNFNIIANPVHFDEFQSFQSAGDKSSKKSNNLSQKSSVPSISALPELDFIAPKNKFFSKK